jgi:hypothetical protein
MSDVKRPADLGRASIKFKNLNYSCPSVFGVIETKFRALLSIFDTFDNLSGYFRPNLGQFL